MKYITNAILRVSALAVLFAANAFAQNNSPALPFATPLDVGGSVVKIFELKHASATDLKNILVVFRAEVSVTGTSPGIPRILSVRAPAEIMPAIEDTIKRFDVEPPPPPARAPTKSIEVSVQILGAYDNAAMAPSCREGCAIPPSLEQVVTQLQKNFSYKTYQLLDTQLFRQIAYTSLSSTNSLPHMIDTSATYTIQWTSAQTSSPESSSIRLTSLKFGADLRIPPATANQHFGFEASEVQVPTDQQVVIGKTTAGYATIILVIRAKVVD